MSEGTANPVNHLYELTLKVSRGAGGDLPAGMIGAFVPCYVAAPDWMSAARKAVAAVGTMGYVFEDIHGQQVREIPIASWGEYVAQVWPEITGHFPTPENLAPIIENGGVFFGPFAGFSD